MADATYWPLLFVVTLRAKAVACGQKHGRIGNHRAVRVADRADDRAAFRLPQKDRRRDNGRDQRNVRVTDSFRHRMLCPSCSAYHIPFGRVVEYDVESVRTAA